MGLARKIAFTGIGSVLALLAIIFIAGKTDILNKITTGLGGLGASLGSGFGIGTRNAAGGFVAGLTGFVPAIDDKGNVFPIPQSLDPKSQGFSAEAGNFGKGFADFITSLFKSLGYVLPEAAGELPSAKTILLQEQLQLSDSSIVTQQNRVYSDLVGVAQKASNTVAQNRAISIANFNRSAVQTPKKVGIRGGYSPGSAATQARRGAGQSKAAKRRARSCFNIDTDMGGLGKIDYRLAGLIQLHG